MSDPILYRDGYTRKVKLKGERGLYGDAEFELRPMLVEDRDELTDFVSKNPPKKFNPVIRAKMAAHVVAWNATDQAGLAVPITPDAFRKMPPRLYDRLYWVLIGREAGDFDSEATDEEQDDYAKRVLAGSDEGDAKN